VITISDSHRLSSSAHNILLKSLEEPLPNTFYLLSASATGKLPLTIISRGVVFNVPPFTDDDLRLVLAKRFGDLFTKIASKLQDDVIKISKGTMTLFAHLLAANGGNHGDSATLWKELLTAYEAVSKYDLKKFSGIAERFSKDETLIEVLITFFINTALSDTFKESRDRGNFLWHLLNFENELQNKGLNRTYRLMNALLWNSPPEKVSPQKV
jgi:DNA polymerase III gamma/tau subunit